MIRFALTVAVAWLVACATTGSDMTGPVRRAAEDVPERFVLDPAMPGDTIPGPGCRSPLFDPRDGTRVIMLRSGGSRADYAVPAGRYGVRQNELLRLECRTGRPVGIVRR